MRRKRKRDREKGREREGRRKGENQTVKEDMLASKSGIYVEGV